MTPSTDNSNPRSPESHPSARRAGRPRRYQQPIEVLRGATRFSDDPDMQNPLWVIRSFKEHPQFCRPLVLGTRVEFENGRPRMEGDWALLYLGYVATGITEVAKFWAKWKDSTIWQECGFAERPSYQLCSLRFAELEHDDLRGAFRDCGAELIRQAIRHDPQVGSWVDYDGTAVQSAARLHHCCPDRETCGQVPGRRAPKILSKSETSSVNQQRHKEPATDGADIRLPEHEELGDDGYRYFRISGHLYRSSDPSSGFRAYSNGTVWHGGDDMKAIDRRAGGTLDHLVISASRNEFQNYPTLADSVEETMGKQPIGISGDRALGFDAVYEHNTRRGIATAIPLRQTRGPRDRGALDTERYDRHGIPRCRYCGGPGDIDSPGLGLYFDRGNPRLRFRCRLGHTPDCDRQQSIACSENWRLLIPLSRTTEQYHALSREGKHSERIHHHARQRYGAAGKDYTGRVKRRNMMATQLRCDAARVIEWLCIDLRNGWLGSHRRRNDCDPRACRPGDRLRSTLAARRRHRLDRPYGRAAQRLGLARHEYPPGREPPDA